MKSLIEKTIPLSKAKKRVARGAKLLDKKVPGWRAKIKIKKLDMRSLDSDILGQLFGTYVDGAKALDFPVSVKGFKAEDSDKEHLIKWVKAPTEMVFKKFLHLFNIESLLEGIPKRFGKYADRYTAEDGVDIILDKEANIKYASCPVAEWG